MWRSFAHFVAPAHGVHGTSSLDLTICPLFDTGSQYWYSIRASGQIFGGLEVPPGSVPFAHCYGGFQFGNWVGQLGDGRAISLGHVIQVAMNEDHDDDEQSLHLREIGRWELQIKGAGRTPYSRSGDGRAVLER